MEGWRNDASLEEQIRILDNDRQAMARELDEVREDVRKLRGELTRTSQDIRKDLRREVADANTRLEDSQVGGLYVALVSAWWLMIGITLATIPDEIALRVIAYFY
jgi:hypothetical protein